MPAAYEKQGLSVYPSVYWSVPVLLWPGGQEISIDCCTAHSSEAGECGQCHVVSVRTAAEHWLVFKKFSGSRGICWFLTYGTGTIMERWQFVFTTRAMLMRHMLSLAVRQIVCMSVRLSVRHKSLFYGAMALDCTPVRYDCWSNCHLPNDF